MNRVRIFVDTNVLCRFAIRTDQQHQEARLALEKAISVGCDLLISPQVEREFWAVATRARSANGIGMTIEETSDAMRIWTETFLQFIPDNSRTHGLWRKLAVEFGVTGKQVHDAAIVAAALASDADRIMTFNHEHFRRYQQLIAIQTPKELMQVFETENLTPQSE